MFLAELTIVFVGIAGNHPETVAHQLEPVLDHAGVTELAIPDGELAAIARHGDAAREIVRKLHVDGVIGGAIIASHGALDFRLVVYDGDGNLKSLGETPLTHKKLSKDTLEVLASNLEDELGGLGKRPAQPTPQPQPAPQPPAQPQIKVAAPPPAPIKVAAPAPPPIKVATKVATAAPSTLAGVTFDREQPPGLGAAAPAPSQRTPHDEETREPHHEAAPVETAAVSLDEIEAMTGGGDGGGDSPSVTAATTVAVSDLHLHAGLAFGLAGRVFMPGPAAVSAYSSRPVGAVGFEVGVAPTARTSLLATAERTVQMSSTVADGMASTTISRWQVSGSFALVRGSVELAPVVGIGHRTFAIDSTDPSRSPDGDYSYLVFGATLAKPLGTHVVLRGLAAFEPVIGGAEPTDMAFGDATRWAFDVGAALELHPFAHAFARAAVDLQRFSWSWDAAGARGAGGASDTYPSGTISVGAEY